MTAPKGTQEKDPRTGSKTITYKQGTQSARRENYSIAPKDTQGKGPKYEEEKKEITAQHEETNYGTKH